MVRLDGTVSISGLPAHLGLIVNLCFLRVRGPDAAPPYGGDPPSEAAIDLHKVWERVDFEKESVESSVEQTFSLKHAPGHYYVQVRAILFRSKAGQPFAQVEQFFFGRTVLHITAGMEATKFPIVWPTRPLEDLHYYGTMTPESS
jgi:hypothetical protein